jgi:PiT family inorganic phosphate transporter
MPSRVGIPSPPCAACGNALRRMDTNALHTDLSLLLDGFQTAASSGTLSLLILALAVSCGFEFINGFHDTANAVATVIYTKSLRPWAAVIWSGICNFVGVFLGGTAVAMGIVKLLPTELLATGDHVISLATVFALLLSACIWNLGTWYYGIPASSSHTLIGSILGVGIGNAYLHGESLAKGVNWSKAADVGLALLISPLVGFTLAGLGLHFLKKFTADTVLHDSPGETGRPPLGIRAALIGTCTGVSLAHGSNDGQKGVGLVMLVLIAVLPAQFALHPSVLQGPSNVAQLLDSSRKVEFALSLSSPLSGQKMASNQGAAIRDQISLAPAASFDGDNDALKSAERYNRDIQTLLASNLATAESRLQLRSKVFQLESQLKKIEKQRPELASLKAERKALFSVVEYAPSWVVVMVAISLGLGTMIGWKRIVVTIGEKIGKAHLTYSQGAIAEMVAMSTIGISALAGVPVSTTHCLSSGIAGTMVANGAGVRAGTVKSILLAWVLTLPVTVALSAGLFVGIAQLIR